MAMISADLTRITDVWFGFDADIQAQVLDQAAELSA